MQMTSVRTCSQENSQRHQRCVRANIDPYQSFALLLHSKEPAETHSPYSPSFLSFTFPLNEIRATPPDLRAGSGEKEDRRWT